MSEKYPDSGILFNYDDNDYCQGYGQIKEAFRAQTKDEIIQPYMSDDDFRSSNAAVNEIGYTLYVLDIRHQQNFTTSRPIKK